MQSNKKSTRGVATREVLRSNDTAKRSAEIVVAARELYEEKGLARTSIQDITGSSWLSAPPCSGISKNTSGILCRRTPISTREGYLINTDISTDILFE